MVANTFYLCMPQFPPLQTKTRRSSSLCDKVIAMSTAQARTEDAPQDRRSRVMNCSYSTLSIFAGIQKNLCFSGTPVVACLTEQELLLYLASAQAHTRHCLLP